MSPPAPLFPEVEASATDGGAALLASDLLPETENVASVSNETNGFCEEKQEGQEVHANPESTEPGANGSEERRGNSVTRSVSFNIQAADSGLCEEARQNTVEDINNNAWEKFHAEDMKKSFNSLDSLDSANSNPESQKKLTPNPRRGGLARHRTVDTSPQPAQKLRRARTVDSVYDSQAVDVFNELSGGSATVANEKFLEALEQQGIRLTDTRIQKVVSKLKKTPELDIQRTVQLFKRNLVFHKSMLNKLAIREFAETTAVLDEIFDELKAAKVEGERLVSKEFCEKIEDNALAISICSVDGQRYSLGDWNVAVPLMSTSKVMSYCMALEERGETTVHQYMGREPSGRDFRERSLNQNGVPHNPFVNAGTIMMNSLIHPIDSKADRWDYILGMFSNAAGGVEPGFNQELYLDAVTKSHRDYCLGYMLRDQKVLDAATEVRSTVDFVLSMRSLEMTPDSLAVIAGTLAAGGTCPVTDQKVFKPSTVKSCLSVMSSCGMYNYSGAFQSQVGIPAKSSISGIVVGVVPNVMGFCVWSPLCDRHGNSILGVEFCKKLVEKCNLHMMCNRLHPRSSLALSQRLSGSMNATSTDATAIELLWTCYDGNFAHARHLLARGSNVNVGDYDHRTPLHLAVASGNLELVEFLLNYGANIDLKDREGNSAVDDARRSGSPEMIKLLEDWNTCTSSRAASHIVAESESVAAATVSPRKFSVISSNFQLPSLLGVFVDLNRSSFGRKELLLAELKRCGLSPQDPRLEPALQQLLSTFQTSTFEDVTYDCDLLRRVVRGELVVPEFEELCSHLEMAFKKAESVKSGRLPTYIPQLAKQNPDHFGLSVCTVDGQRHSIGDTKIPFSLQAMCKVINYALAQVENGADEVHKFVGREPNGRNFNELELNQDNLPHNPLINAGALLCCSMIRPRKGMSERFAYIRNTWKALNGDHRPGFSNATYLSESETADRNFSLAYMMREQGVFPKKTNIHDTLSLYFMGCAMEMTCEDIAMVAASLANDGVCPLTGKRVLPTDVVTNCLSMMHCAGMYDYSGEFQYLIGFPAKSGISGCIMCVIPEVMGMCVWSPRVDKYGNSARGVALLKEIASKYMFHTYDPANVFRFDRSRAMNIPIRQDPRGYKYEAMRRTSLILEAAGHGDLIALQNFAAKGISLNVRDYDGRTPLHVACSEGRQDVVKFLLRMNVATSVCDRWGRTPAQDAERLKFQSISDILSRHKVAGEVNSS